MDSQTHIRLRLSPRIREFSRPRIMYYFGVIRREKLLSSLQCRKQIN